MLVLTRTRRAVRLSLGRLGARLVPVLLAGCYSYTPLATVAPTPGLRLSLALTDQGRVGVAPVMGAGLDRVEGTLVRVTDSSYVVRSEEHTSELQSRPHLVCRLLLEKKKTQTV